MRRNDNPTWLYLLGGLLAVGTGLFFYSGGSVNDIRGFFDNPGMYVDRASGSFDRSVGSAGGGITSPAKSIGSSVGGLGSSIGSTMGGFKP